MATVHEQLAEHSLEELMAAPGWAEMVASWARKIRTGEVSLDELAVYGQTDRRAGRWPMEQLAAAIRVHTYVINGVYLFKTYFIDAQPLADAKREENEALLREHLPHPFTASVNRADLTDDDGTLTWSSPILVNRSTAETPDRFTAEGVVLAGDSVPLEIGTTLPSRTLHHLVTDGGVARWPYGRDFVQVILDPARYRDLSDSNAKVRAFLDGYNEASVGISPS